MFAWLRRRPAAALPAIPPGERVFAIGDVHGRLDLLEAMFDMIERDLTDDPSPAATIVLLGDLIDRGPDSAGVIEAIVGRIAAGWPIRAIMGNHEEVLLAALAGDADQLRRLLRFGGVPTLESYGLTMPQLDAVETDAEGIALLSGAIPASHQAFLGGMESMIVIGDYLFVHAGIRPGVPLAEQSPADLRWIRKPFLAHRQPFDATIVHGHSIRTLPDLRHNRLGIDTGAYRTGRLTALILEGTARRVLQTEPTAGDEAGG